jgi:uncharacterized LabA/DUF88 family protein
MQSKEQTIAVLIDAENAQLSSLDSIMAELSKHGHIITKRAYADWTIPALKNWKSTMNELVIQPIQQFSYTKGKNSSDAALIIDAMDMLYSNKYSAFALISSDSDFTKLASRLKESQIYVYGVGEKKTPTAFINACDDFVYVEVLKSLDTEDEKKSPRTQKKQIAKRVLSKDTKLITILRNAAEECMDEDGWAPLAESGALIKKQFPDFDPRNYGFTKLSKLIEETKVFDIYRDKERKATFYRDVKLYGDRK